MVLAKVRLSSLQVCVCVCIVMRMAQSAECFCPNYYIWEFGWPAQTLYTINDNVDCQKRLSFGE